jgi:uncharacterized membrane protein YfcA
VDLWVALAGFGVGVIVGLTGMGGGALMTPLLVLFFGVPPLSAVSNDLVASAIMKPFGGAIHMRRGTVDGGLVRWLCLGSIPAAFAGVFIARAIGPGERVQQVIQVALGVALLLAALGLVAKAYLSLRDRARARRAGPVAAEAVTPAERRVRVRRIPTLLVGVVGGLVVGITSVGSGSLIVVALLALYPALRANDLVGTDLVQAVPLVASAALAHLLFGDFEFALTLSLVVGSVPGVVLGATLSSRAPGGLIRAALAVVLVASALKLLGVPTTAVGLSVAALVALAPVAWMLVRVRVGLPAWGLSPGVGDPDAVARGEPTGSRQRRH